MCERRICPLNCLRIFCNFLCVFVLWLSLIFFFDLLADVVHWAFSFLSTWSCPAAALLLQPFILFALPWSSCAAALLLLPSPLFYQGHVRSQITSTRQAQRNVDAVAHSFPTEFTGSGLLFLVSQSSLMVSALRSREKDVDRLINLPWEKAMVQPPSRKR